MINELQAIDEHTLIRETIGYKAIEQIEVFDIPNVLKFLEIVWNYDKMFNLLNSKK